MPPGLILNLDWSTGQAPKLAFLASDSHQSQYTGFKKPKQDHTVLGNVRWVDSVVDVSLSVIELLVVVLFKVLVTWVDGEISHETLFFEIREQRALAS